jgi:hypothetical protein
MKIIGDKNMASIKDHISTDVTKLLLVGDSGSGKTASLAALANAGYNLRILDYDDGLAILPEFLKPDAVDKVSYVTLKDPIGRADAFRKGVNLISSWKDKEEEFGPVGKWTSKDVLVIDSLTLMGEAALRGALVFNNKKPTDQASQPEWGTAARDVQHIIQYLTGSEVPCNVVVTTHMQYMEGDMGVSKAYPTSVGSKLSTKIGRYFNCVCRIDTRSSSKGVERTLRTVSDHRMDLKVTAPKLIEPNTVLDLAKLFDSIQKNARQRLSNKDNVINIKTGGK